ncbi:FecR domain-containing protein [Herbaspirillum sp. SJZ099]|uniref:FecR family protein n=1 Tax=Herbaspirillum sp. SJZ099 TaxID=2572916 RepID=UPI002104CDA7|nr:FecR domain-containing protein [Herbaspirillum sp. SJZ099]
MAMVVAALACAASGAQAQENRFAGIMKVVRGDVQVQRQEQKLPAQVGDKLYSGDRIVTAADAAAGITLRDDTLMSLGPKTSFVLEDFKFNESSGDGNIAVRVAKGTLRYVSGLIGKHAPERQQVATPTATIGIRGTDFIVEVGDE